MVFVNYFSRKLYILISYILRYLSVTELQKDIALDLSTSLSENQIASLVTIIRHRNNISDRKLNSILKSDEIFIPLSIMDSNLSLLEAIVKYLRENLNLKNKEISELTNRDSRSVSTTYSFAQKKQKKQFKKIDFSYSFPLSILASRRLSVLESVSIYFYKTQKLSVKFIAEILNRNYQTIWTVIRRANLK